MLEDRQSGCGDRWRKTRAFSSPAFVDCDTEDDDGISINAKREIAMRGTVAVRVIRGTLVRIDRIELLPRRGPPDQERK